MSSKNNRMKEEKIKDEKSSEKNKKEKDNLKSEEKKNVNENLKEKKPNELKDFDAVTHFKHNIIHFYKNCSEPIKDLSYYCFTCKHSVCNECGVLDHKNHILIQRDNCLNYDNTFFNEISKVIENGINLESKKFVIKEEISKSINHLKEQLDLIEKEKLQQVYNIFKGIKSNYINLKENYLKTKECIEKYYKTNKKFFNIKIKKTKQNNAKNQDNEDKENENKKNNQNKEKNNMVDNIKSSVINYFKINENEVGPNRDIENTIFLMNFELMNLCDNKNLQILEVYNNVNNRINDMSKLIEDNTKTFTEEFKSNYLDFDEERLISKFDDFYRDIKLRCEKYTEHIAQFQNTLYDIYKRNGCLDKLKDLLSIFDSKNNKGKDVLFNQQFFIKMNDLSSLNTDFIKNMSKKIYFSNGKVRSTSKNRFGSKSKLALSGMQSEKKDENKKSNKSIDKTKSKNILNKDNSEIISSNKEGEIKLELKKNPTNMAKFNTVIPKKENIILNHRLVQRFYAYSVLDYYSKYFKINRNNDDKEIDEENNIYVINKNPSNNEGLKNKKGFANKNGLKGRGPLAKINESNKENSNNLDPKNLKNKLKSHAKSVSLLSNYTERYNELKEKVKPIPNANYIQLFDRATTKITKIKVPLTKEEHGYTTFPDGCRRLLIDSDLFITGGTDNCGYPINIVLNYNLAIGELNRLSNLNDNHSYHSVEYLENFDSIIVVGGENSSSCEIMDLDSKKWTKLPSLNYPRANSNIYYNNVTSDLFVLFGMEGEMTEKTKNTDVIEVLELNDIIGGWMMVDYYKSVGLDLKSKYCITLPFTRDKLLVYGGSSARSLEKRLFALFDMIKNECIKVDSETMDLIKREENKIRAFDNAIEKIT